MSINAILLERGTRYGPFKGHAEITQKIKRVIKEAVDKNENHPLSWSQEEALEMIAHKMGRILNGDPDYKDSWVDIAGYAQLVADELTEEQDDA